MTLPLIDAKGHDDARHAQPALRAAGIALLVPGLLGHLYAAHAIGGSRVAYTHHVLGFFLILAVTGGIIAVLGWRFWRAHPDRTMLAVGLVQALLGLLIAMAPGAATHGG